MHFYVIDNMFWCPVAAISQKCISSEYCHWCYFYFLFIIIYYFYLTPVK